MTVENLEVKLVKNNLEVSLKVEKNKLKIDGTKLSSIKTLEDLRQLGNLIEDVYEQAFYRLTEDSEAECECCVPEDVPPALACS